MPKYFDGEKDLPFDRIDIDIDAVNCEALESCFASRDSFSLCVRLPGLDNSCLGYIFNIQRSSGSFLILDITRKLLTTRGSVKDLESLIRHAVGYAYDENVHRILSKLRDIED